jgi:hypothetical protein
MEDELGMAPSTALKAAGAYGLGDRYLRLPQMESEQVMAPGQSGKLCVPSGIRIVTFALLQSVFVVGFDGPPWNQYALAYGSVLV